MKTFSFNPPTTAANTAFDVPAEFGAISRLIAVDLVNMTAAPAVTTKEVPQDVATTASGQSYLSSATQLMLGDAVTISEDRVFVTAVMLGEEPVGAAA